MRQAIQHLKRRDPVLGRLIESGGPYRMEYREPRFDALARSIVYQQLSGKAASTIFGRLLAAAGDGELSPETVLKLRPVRLRSLGLSKQKVVYLRDLARRTLNGKLSFEALPDLPDEQVIELLTEVKGIGVWTAHMFLIFALRRPDVLPVGDLGIRTAIKKHYQFEVLPAAAEIEQLAEKWRPYCSVASWYLWRSLAGQAAL
jgi:DNA-3-methyladenine glycosylase II